MRYLASAVGLLAALSATDARATERGVQQLDAFIVDACEYFAENEHITAEQAQPHFGKLLKREWVTKQVGTPHARFHVNATRLPGWQVSLEERVSIDIKVPRSLRISVGDLEKLIGEAQTDDADPIPARFVVEQLGPAKVCSVIIFGDRKSGADDWHRQRILAISIVD